MDLESIDVKETNSYQIWPPEEYEEQLQTLRNYIGKEVYLVQIKLSDIHLTYFFDSKPYTLHSIISHPSPSREQRIFPHVLVLENYPDMINLGRVARITTTPFDPSLEETLYLDAFARKDLFESDNRITKEEIGRISHGVLSQIVGANEIEKAELPNGFYLPRR